MPELSTIVGNWGNSFSLTCRFATFVQPFLLQLNHLQVADVAGFDYKADEGANHLLSVQSGGSGIDVETTEVVVHHHLEDVRMARDEEFWRVGDEHGSDAAVITPRVSAYVFHEHIDAFALEPQHLRKSLADVGSIDVAIYGTQRSNGQQPFGYLKVTDVASMPYFITPLGIVLKAWIPVRVCVGEEKNLGHSFTFFNVLFGFAKTNVHVFELEIREFVLFVVEFHVLVSVAFQHAMFQRDMVGI